MANRDGSDFSPGDVRIICHIHRRGQGGKTGDRAAANMPTR